MVPSALKVGFTIGFCPDIKAPIGVKKPDVCLFFQLSRVTGREQIMQIKAIDHSFPLN